MAAVADQEVGIRGLPRSVVEHLTDERFATDVKLPLADPAPKTCRRDGLRIAADAFLAQRRGASDATVRRTVETFGVATAPTTPPGRP